MILRLKRRGLIYRQALEGPEFLLEVLKSPSQPSLCYHIGVYLNQTYQATSSTYAKALKISLDILRFHLIIGPKVGRTSARIVSQSLDLGLK